MGAIIGLLNKPLPYSKNVILPRTKSKWRYYLDFVFFHGDIKNLKTLYIVPFTHNMLSDIYKSFLDFFSGQFPRINWKVMGTYFKAVEFLNKKDQMGREVDMPMLPMMSLNPSGEFVIEEKYGRMFWRFPYLAPGLTSSMFTPIYQDQYVKITPNFTRLRGELEIGIGTASYYEYLDYKVFLNLLFDTEFIKGTI